MQLRTLAEIATILGLAIAVLGYFKVVPNALDEIPEIHKAQAARDVGSVSLKLEEKDYLGERSGLYHQYKAAIAMVSSYNKDRALSAVIDNALAKGEFRLAILSGKDISSSYSKSAELAKIVAAAVNEEETVGFAIIAAELIPSSYSKDTALDKIVRRYEKGKGVSGILSPPTELDIYKEIFHFADSTANMNMSEIDAKKFADDWMKTRSYEEFKHFKEVFKFADSTANMGMTEIDARDFALAWIANHTKEEFEVFTSAFTFADSSAGMGMSERDAAAFAFKKVEEHRQTNSANKSLRPTSQSAAAKR